MQPLLHGFRPLPVFPTRRGTSPPSDVRASPSLPPPVWLVLLINKKAFASVQTGTTCGWQTIFILFSFFLALALFLYIIYYLIYNNIIFYIPSNINPTLNAEALMEESQLDLSQIKSIKTAYILSMFSFIFLLILSILGFWGYAYLNELSDGFYIILLWALQCFIFIILALYKNMNRKYLIIIFLLVYAICSVSINIFFTYLAISYSSISTLKSILNNLNSIILIIYFCLFLRKVINKSIKNTLIKPFFILYSIILLINNFYNILSNVPTSKYPISIMFMEAIVFTFFPFIISYIVYKGSKNEGFYEFFIETFPSEQIRKFKI